MQTNNSSVTTFELDGWKKKQPVRIKGVVHNQFGVPGKWLKGNLHNHLDRPGNEKWLADAVEHYHQLGYDFIAGMEHDRIVDVSPRPDLVVVPGAEVSGPGHTLVFGLDELPVVDARGEACQRMAALIRSVKQKGGMTFLAHPFKSGYSWSDLKLLCGAGLDGIEVVNSNVRGKIADSGRADQIWHNLLREGESLIAIGGDDAHGHHEDIGSLGWGGFSHMAWTGLLAGEFSSAGILEALRAGRTYASEGPRIRGISCSDDGKMKVSCTPCVSCHFRSVGGSWGGASVFPDEDAAASDRFVFDFATSGYRIQDRLVVVLQDEYGRRAWTSPIRADIQFFDR